MHEREHAIGFEAWELLHFAPPSKRERMIRTVRYSRVERESKTAARPPA